MSQKGGVGKSTLARALATFASKNGSNVTLVDLDHEQRTVTVWEHSRSRHGVNPVLHVTEASSEEVSTCPSMRPVNYRHGWRHYG